MDPEEVWLSQYTECWREINDYDRLIWQTPTVTLAILTFFAIAYLGYAHHAPERLLLTLGAVIITSAQRHALMKHRFFQDTRVSDFLALQKLLEEKVPIYALKWRTEHILLQKSAGRYSDVSLSPEFLSGRSSYKIMEKILLAFILFWILLLGYHAAELLESLGILW